MAAAAHFSYEGRFSSRDPESRESRESRENRESREIPEIPETAETAEVPEKSEKKAKSKCMLPKRRFLGPEWMCGPARTPWTERLFGTRFV
jgi:hypothetical protein